MKAIILAAGAGRRLQDISKGLPKSMIKINGTSLIHRQIDSCLNIGISKFVFVLGYKKEKIQKHILNILNEEQVSFIINPVYDRTNTLHSLWLTRKQFDDDFIYFNADVLFQKAMLDKIAEKSEYSQLLLETKSCEEEEVKMIIDNNMRILQIGKQLEIPKCAGEFIGIGKFNIDVLEKFSNYLQYGVDNGQSNNYFEYAVNLLAKDDILKAVPTGDLNCIEIDFPEDLKRAKEMFE